MTIIETDRDYCFEVSEITTLDYKFASSIIKWLTGNMEALTDKNDNPIFGKVNTGYSEENLRSFGGKPVCDVYFDNADYDSSFDANAPEIAHTIILVHLKGNNNHTYLKACELHDYILQELIENESYRCLTDVVRDTVITNSEVKNTPLGKKWGVIVAFELSHKLY